MKNKKLYSMIAFIVALLVIVVLLFSFHKKQDNTTQKTGQESQTEKDARQREEMESAEEQGEANGAHEITIAPDEDVLRVESGEESSIGEVELDFNQSKQNSKTTEQSEQSSGDHSASPVGDSLNSQQSEGNKIGETTPNDGQLSQPEAAMPIVPPTTESIDRGQTTPEPSESGEFSNNEKEKLPDSGDGEVELPNSGDGVVELPFVPAS